LRTLSFLLLPMVLAGCSDPVRPPVPSTDLGSVADSTTDAPAVDSPSTDRPSDVPADAPTDVPSDVRVDAALDVSTDIPTDIPSDTPLDIPTDIPTDIPSDIPSDLGFDAPSDTGSDAGPTDAPAADAVFDDSGLGAWVTLGDGTCGARARRVAAIPGAHVDPDAGPIEWLTNPPSSGNHFGSWAHWGAWPDLARGYWVHNLEHGGVAFLYRCATAPCTATRDALVSVMNSLPVDPACMPTDAEPTRARVVITNDALITTPIAASAWGAVYEASCVDAASLRQFYAMFAGHAPEDFCADGFVP
jgi:hypothetical protein